MANITWKNINSDTLTGLIITELPPITKPKMKTEITDVDGRDGDIIDELGYQSYTKTIKIGLSRNYDVDEIMKYFTGTGELITSEEPDKVYNSTIIDKVDYDKLLRFKKADIKFYTQPFKYLKDEPKVELTINTETNIEVENKGLEIAKPIIKLTGSGTIEISVNGFAVFTYTFPDGETEVVIDSIQEEAYINGVYKNRNMLGEFPKLNVGINTIGWTGTLTKISIEPKSRWL